ncbi:hypothetical protein EVAR_35913_1 [Eumeta japonica]|uniref:PiggyBac transposable element-derived protein domain-containing protein n=1 Tax=Eumeta variegata TaxID=151549 RepID=A0A4C1WTN9_EUMVA|nr:hypothetical protein EVAR_35913_1 [Eumeta japonica]
MILAYNKAKGAVDLSDQMTSYSSPLRKTVKWYKKLGIELILNTALVNTWKDETEDVIVERPKRLRHGLLRKEGSVRTMRRFCIECYKDCVKTFGSRAAKNKAKKVKTYCNECPNKPYLCLDWIGGLLYSAAPVTHYREMYDKYILRLKNSFLKPVCSRSPVPYAAV